jgi:hypothetical protein
VVRVVLSKTRSCIHNRKPARENAMSTKTKPSPCWRDTLPIHPAAELFPRMSPDELQALGDDVVVKNGSRATAK